MADAREPTLFDVTTAADPSVPRCRMCARPARWVAKRQEWGMYCAGTCCTNRERICQVCDGPFHVGIDGAGNKYCSPDCKAHGYGRSVPGSTALISCCAWCGKRAPKGSRFGLGGPERIWPYICADCTWPIRHLVHRLRKHHVPHDIARRLLDDPCCPICSRDIVSKVRDPNTGKVRSLLVVDHDHTCCPGSVSCGLCVRGFLCGQCNSAAGLLGEDPERVLALVRYLKG